VLLTEHHDVVSIERAHNSGGRILGLRLPVRSAAERSEEPQADKVWAQAIMLQ
jgi:hypothetical protein